VACSRQTRQLIGPICKLQRKGNFVNPAPDDYDYSTHNKIVGYPTMLNSALTEGNLTSTLRNLVSSPTTRWENKLECFSLAKLVLKSDYIRVEYLKTPIRLMDLIVNFRLKFKKTFQQTL
jgi:hypothetical protein